jgi:hypothetical protein
MVMTVTVEQFYEKFVKSMSTGEQLQLIALITPRLAVDLPLVETLEATQLPELPEQVQADMAAYEHIGELPPEQKGSPQAVLQLAGTLSAEEADAILQVAQTARQIDWEMWNQATFNISMTSILRTGPSRTKVQ